MHNHLRSSAVTWGESGLTERYTRREVGRILGLETGRLRYWEKLKLVRPKARWGERFYSFGDLVAVRTIQQLTHSRIPALRVRRAVNLLERQFGESPLPLERLRLFEHAGEIVVVPPGAQRPFNPIRQQWIFPFDNPLLEPKLRTMSKPSAQALFEAALECESSPDLLPQAVESYRQVVDIAPGWIEAHINLGVAYYQMGQLKDAHTAFLSAVRLDPLNGISLYNLGCVMEEEGFIDQAIVHLQRAARIMPAYADVHFNLALAFEKSGDRRSSRDEWELYLRYAPSGPWADQARARLREFSARPKRSSPIPFPRKVQRTKE